MIFKDNEEIESKLILNSLLITFKNKDFNINYIDTCLTELLDKNRLGIRRITYLNFYELELLKQFLKDYELYLKNNNIENKKISLINSLEKNYVKKELFSKYVNKIRFILFKCLNIIDNEFKIIFDNPKYRINERKIDNNLNKILKIINNHLSYFSKEEIIEIKQRLMLWKRWIINDDYIDIIKYNVKIDIVLNYIERRLQYYNHEIYVLDKIDDKYEIINNTQNTYNIFNNNKTR